MKKTRIIAMAIAALLFVLALINPIKGNQKIAEEDLVKVVIATVDIGNRTKITQEMIEVKKIHKASAPENPISEIEEVVGKISLVSMFRGDIFIPQKIDENGGINAGVAVAIESGMRAISMNVEPDTGLSGLINIGDKVDIITVIDKDPDKVGIVILQEREVLAIDNKIRTNADQSPDSDYYSNITLSVTPKEALEFSLSQTIGMSNRVILRNPEDKQKSNIGNITQKDLLR